VLPVGQPAAADVFQLFLAQLDLARFLALFNSSANLDSIGFSSSG